MAMAMKYDPAGEVRSPCEQPTTFTSIGSGSPFLAWQPARSDLGAAMIALGQFVAASSVTATIVSIPFPSDIRVLESIMSEREWVGPCGASERPRIRRAFPAADRYAFRGGPPTWSLNDRRGGFGSLCPCRNQRFGRSP